MPALQVMLSSRVTTALPVSAADPTEVDLSSVRQNIKADIEAEPVFGFEQGIRVWINEEEGAAAADLDSWETCMQAAAASDLVLVVYSGEAGWSADNGDLGICHAEMSSAMTADPSKVYGVSVENAVNVADPTVADQRFQEYWTAQSIFRDTAESAEELREVVRKTVGKAIIDRALRSRAQPRSDAYGEALNWSRMSYRDRKLALESIVCESMTGDNAPATPEPVSWELQDTTLAAVVHGLPDSLSVGAAREMVGQPFLYDHELDLPEDAPGPVHVIACHKNVTESQARRILGFPDALIVKTRFGIYVADETQRIQLIFLRHCSDPSATREAVRRLRDWLTQTAEAGNLIRRARRRREIVDLMSEHD